MYFNTELGDSKNNNNKGKWFVLCCRLLRFIDSVDFFLPSSLSLIPIEISSAH